MRRRRQPGVGVHRREARPDPSVREVLGAGRGRDLLGLGRDAAARLLARNPVPLEEIGLVLYAGSSEWGTPFWSPAAKIAQELGIADAHCFEVSNFCNAGMVAVKLADDQVRAGTHKHALVIISDRLSQLVEYGTRYIELFNFADGAAAVLISADAKYEVLGAAHHTDPQWVDSYYGEIKEGRVKVERGEKLDGLGEAFLDNFTALTHKVLMRPRAEGGRRVVLPGHARQPGHPPQVPRRTGRAHLPQRLPVRPRRPPRRCGPVPRLGGAGAGGPIASGDLVVVATAGSGFTWGVTAIRRT